jgi:hypothetical protein
MSGLLKLPRKCSNQASPPAATHERAHGEGKQRPEHQAHGGEHGAFEHDFQLKASFHTGILQRAAS